MSINKRSCLINIIIATSLLLSIARVNSQVVCSQDELVRELREDLEDNGKLDCLRVGANPEAADESQEQREKRLAANWDSDCSFEACDEGPTSWIAAAKNTFDLKKGLLDVNGNPTEKDFADQADMCELVRSLVGNGKVPEIGEDLNEVSDSLLDLIDCPGEDGQTEVCAATGGSFAEQKGWLIMLDGQSIRISKEPKYILAGSEAVE